MCHVVFRKVNGGLGKESVVWSDDKERKRSEPSGTAGERCMDVRRDKIKRQAPQHRPRGCGTKSQIMSSVAAYSPAAP